MESSDFEPLLGKNVLAQNHEGRVFAGRLQRTLGQFDILTEGRAHHLFWPHDILSVREASAEEVGVIRDLCTCDSDSLLGPECPVHMTEDMRDIVDVPPDHGVCLRVPPQSFHSARTKLNRASRTMLRLQREIADYDAREPRTMEALVNGDNVDFVFRIVEEMPDELPALASAAIHNLRSCLDSVAWSVWRKTGGTLAETLVTFALRETHALLLAKKSQDTLVATGGNAWRDFINRNKPCGDGNEALWILHRLDILDKHRDLIEIAASPVGLQITSPVEARMQVVKGTGFYRDGDVVATCKKGYACSVTLNTRITFEGFDRFRADHVMDAMRVMHREVCRVLANAEKAFP